MPEDNEIDDLSIRITADASEFLEGLEAAMQKALGIAETQAAKIATDWVDVFADVYTKAMEHKVDDFKAAFAKLFEVYAAAPTEAENIQQFKQQMYELFAVIEEAHPELPIPAMEDLGFFIQGMQASIAAGRTDLEEFLEHIQQFTGDFETLGMAASDAGPLVATLTEHFKTLGKNVPYAELERFGRRLEAEAAAAEKAGADTEEVSAILRQLTNDFHEHINTIAKAEEVSYRVQIATQEMTAVFNRLGKEVPVERIEEFSKKIENVWKQGLEVDKPIKDLVERTNELKREFFGLEMAEDQVAEGLEAIKKGFAETGRAIPVTQLGQFEKGLRNVIKASKEQGLSIEETNKQLQMYIKSVTEVREPTTIFDRGLKQLASRFLSLAGLIMLWNRLKSKLNELYQIGLKYSEANYKMAVAVKEHDVALAGLGFTMGEVTKHADMLADKYKLNRLEARKLMSEAMLTTHELKLSKDQIKKLTESAAIMGTVFGEDATTMLSTFTNYLTSNYIAGMQQLGFDIDENTMRVEAIKRGFIELGDELDKHTMKMVGLEMIQERANDLSEEAARHVDILAGKQEDLTERMEIVSEKIGSVWGPAMLKMKEFAVEAAEGATAVIVKLFDTLGKGLYLVDAHFKAMERAREQAVAEAKEAGAYPGVRGAGLQPRIAELYEEYLPEEQEKAVREYMGVIGEAVDETERASTALESVQNRLRAYLGEFIDTVIEAADKTAQELEKIEKEYEQRARKLRVALSRQLAELDEMMAKRRKDAWKKLLDSIDDINRRSSERRAQVERQHQEDSEREKREHLLRMKRMEEDFILSLEDAVRERDAKQVLILKRQYSIERKRAEEDQHIRKKQRTEDYKLRLHEIEVQRRLAIQARQDAYVEEMQKIAEQENERRQKLIDNYQQQLKDLRDNLMQRLKDKYDYIVDDLELTDMHLEALRKRLERFYGENGWLDSLWDYATAVAAQASALLAQALGMTVGTSTATTYPRMIGEPRQRGGTKYAMSPTMLMVGETPERVDITRLSAATGAVREPRATTGFGGQAVQIDLNVLADDRLIVEVADQTMNEIADVYVNIQRQTQRRLRQ